MRLVILILLAGIASVSCKWNPPASNEGIMEDSTIVKDTLLVTDTLHALAPDSFPKDQAVNKDTVVQAPAAVIDTKNANPQMIVAFAKTLMGTPYVYGSTNPSVGFDCSGFITHVFNHFNIKVPRSSIDFTNYGKTIPESEAKQGDLILFTGTNPMEKHVGHMGIVISADTAIQFIHSSSGKAMGVTVSPLEGYYRTRFVKVIRIF
jgi:cell wall-associated NlpC family hydrolase